MVVGDLEAASHGQDDPSPWQGTCSSSIAKIRMLCCPGWLIVRKIVFSCFVTVREVPGLSKYNTASATYIPEFLCYITFHFPKAGFPAAGKSEFFRKLEVSEGWVRGIQNSSHPYHKPKLEGGQRKEWQVLRKSTD